MNTSPQRDKAVFVGVQLPGTDSFVFNDHLDELEFLADTAGLSAAGRFVQRLPRPLTNTYLGKGKLEELAAFIQKSPSRTSHLVREYFGCSFQHLVTDIRINRAMAMLTQTNYSVAHIAMELGFSDQSHFTHSFKKWISVTPLAYRKKHGNI